MLQDKETVSEKSRVEYFKSLEYGGFNDTSVIKESMNESEESKSELYRSQQKAAAGASA